MALVDKLQNAMLVLVITGLVAVIVVLALAALSILPASRTTSAATPAATPPGSAMQSTCGTPGVAR